MASLTSNPMEEMLEEDEYKGGVQGGAGPGPGYRRSWSTTDSEPQRPNTLRLASGMQTKLTMKHD